MIYFYYFIMFFGLGTLMNYISIFFLETTPMTESQVTMMLAFVPILSFLSSNLFAYLSDKSKKYKGVLKFVMVTTILSSIGVILIARMNKIVLIVIGYYLLAFFMTSPYQLSENFALQFSKDKNVPYGRIRLFGSLGYAIAGFLGGYITQRWGLQIIFVIFAICMLIPLLFVNRLGEIEDVIDLEPTQHGVYKTLFKNKRYVLILLISFFILGSINVIATFFGIYISEYAHLDLKFLGLTVLITAGTEIPMMYFSNTLIEKFGPYRILAFAAILNALRFLTYLMVPQGWLLLLVSATHGVGYGSAFASIMHLISEHVSASIRASAISLNTTLAIGIGSFGITFLASRLLNARTVFGLLAFFEILGLMLCVYVIKFEKNRDLLKLNNI